MSQQRQILQSRLAPEEMTSLKSQFAEADELISRVKNVTKGNVALVSEQLAELTRELKRLTYYQTGPDDHDTIDNVTVTGDQLIRSYSEYQIWGAAFTNSGSNALYLTFKPRSGNYKQYTIAASASLNLDVKGGLGNSLGLKTDSGSTTTVKAFILLKKPFS